LGDSSDNQLRKLERELEEKNALLLIYKEEIVRMNEKLNTILKQLDSDLSIANSIQNLLVPTEIPNIKGFEFSNKFRASLGSGGDYYEIIHHEDKYKFAMLMASSSGYAMSALFMSVLLKITNKVAKKKGYSPIEFCEKIQNEMRQHMKETDRFALIYTQIDRKKNEISYAGCGNIKALRWNSKEENFEDLDLETAFIQSAKKIAFSQNKFRYYTGDRIVIASAGFIEQKNQKANDYGPESLEQYLAENISQNIHGLRNGLFVDLEQFSKGVEQQKDWSLILMDVKSNLVKLSLK